ncbi:TetR/AcrR family transcriptional regulator [Prosthecobacter sp.]|uniref:TetR/AcrR family transcriptional regulator n=1 Tax=Prosthecobacter sp. TaxID=1965333 RepID=UPI001DF9A6DF|nr:TetR/AcrR family transcriptional regulator [Prosthecobacter sp.]MCB1277774.1 TetR/AcrR family transcriptional regulator [Prosthecobacter sp.]
MKKDVKPTREAVLDSAIAAFGRKGYAGTSVSDIVQATGLSKPTLYYYFGSKEGLFCAILESAYDGSARRMEENMHGADGCYDKLVEAATGLFEFASAHQDLMRLVFSSMFAAPGEIPAQAVMIQPKRRLIVNMILKLIQEGQKDGTLSRDHRADEIVQAYLGAVSQQIRMWLLLQEGTLTRARAARVVKLLFEGAAAKPLS